MKHLHFQELRLENFRCFREQQTARLAPLTLLVGENSTGKTSFLAGVRAAWDAVYQQTEPDFRASPYDLGAFREIAFSEGDGEDEESFEIGFSGLPHRGRKIAVDIRFESRAAVPFPASISVESKSAWIMCAHRNRDKATIGFGSKGNYWFYLINREHPLITPYRPFLLFIHKAIQRLDDIPVEKMYGTMDAPDADTIKNVLKMIQELSFPITHEKPFSGAPIRSSPHRTYDPSRPLPDPEGAYIPTYFASVNFRDKDQWKELKASLERFGKTSGLFHEIGVKQLGDMEGGPFQMEIRIGGTGKAGRRGNLIDVGYGVSQALPVLAEILRPDSAQMLLFQQPEVHLHPSAQAALGSLFCSAAAAGRQLIVETHSDYIVDRVLLDIRDKRTDLKPDDVSILYFKRADHAVTIHSIRIDAEGNVLDAPEGYRKFFKDELQRVIDY